MLDRFCIWFSPDRESGSGKIRRDWLFERDTRLPQQYPETILRWQDRKLLTNRFPVFPGYAARFRVIRRSPKAVALSEFHHART